MSVTVHEIFEKFITCESLKPQNNACISYLDSIDLKLKHYSNGKIRIQIIDIIHKKWLNIQDDLAKYKCYPNSLLANIFDYPSPLSLY